MKKSTLTLIVATLIAFGIAGLVYVSSQDNEDTANTSTDTSQQSQAPAQGDTESTEQNESETQGEQVAIEDMAFTPSNITVKKGSTVTWTNKDAVQHNVVPDDGDSEAFRGSELLSKNSSYSFIFNTPGTYSYHCGPHPQMTGTVTVTE